MILKKKPDLNKVENSVNTLSKRGPDGNGIYNFRNVALGHSRLAIIDVTEKANQPFTDATGQYTIVFNGEFYNFSEHRKLLREKGYKFRSTSDTEVLLYLYIDEGPGFLEKVNGFFALAIFNKNDQSLFIARDRIGIKPLLIYKDTEKLIFASEMKAILEYDIPREMDYTSVFQYFQLNYIPPDNSALKNIIKLKPGTYITVDKNDIIEKTYYQIPFDSANKYDGGYINAQKKLNELLSKSVERRMISDVPLGAFLSGGIDSSIIVALASEFTDKLNTFTIGFKDQPFFDETNYASLVANKYNTNHTVFSLSNQDLYEDLFDVLEYLDEPFADSSAIAVHILSKHTRKNITVALSGDGADEMFAGYNKHRAHYISNNINIANTLIKFLNPLIKRIPQSRNAKIPNLIRQLDKLGNGLLLNARDRYYLWCSILNEKTVEELLVHVADIEDINRRKAGLTRNITANNINEILYSDMHIVLQGDMLRKVDSMSMANSLEVRTPFLDHEVVDYMFSLPVEFKIDKYNQKKILKDTFRSYLPDELCNRPKHGFEVPLLQWFKSELNDPINNKWLKDEFIIHQGIFNVHKIRQLKDKIFSSNPGDVQATIWALIVFQHWWTKIFD